MEKQKSELNNLLYMKVAEAYELSKSSALADKIWQFKNPNESIDHNNKEYISWINSLPIFLECVHDANLDDLYVVFEMKTPISNKAIDVILLGNITDYLKNKKGVNSKKGVLIVELKQWCEIFPCKYEINGEEHIDRNNVDITGQNDKRRHPLRQLSIYEKNLKNHHSGIQKANEPCIDIIFGKLAYLHNFNDPKKLYTGEYNKYKKLGKKHIYGGGDEEKKRLVKNLKLCFINGSDDELLEILNDYEAVMGDEGLAGLEKAYQNQATYTMMQDQQEITDFVSEHLKRQKQNPHKEIIVISGGPGTGKTIAGIRFILEYVSIFNNGRNDNKVIFCLPKSKTVKAVFDAACSVDNENEYCCYLDEIAENQNLVVVDEAHRILDLEEKLNTVFNKGTKLLILLQDDHQLVRPGEQGTFSRFKDYASRNNIEFSPSDENQKKTLTLIDEKRCDPALYDGLIKLLYDDMHPLTKPIDCVHVFNNLSDLMSWRDNLAKESRTKYVFPFAWPWTSRNDSSKKDVEIREEKFEKQWNPSDTDDQVFWLNDNKDDRVACIYTSQGLDMDNVALVWWDDLRWDPNTNNWVVDHKKLKDYEFEKLENNTHANHWISKDDYGNVIVVTRDELDMLIKNTYYVLLSRPRKQLGIWFHDKATKEHVLEVWGIASE